MTITNKRETGDIDGYYGPYGKIKIVAGIGGEALAAEIAQTLKMDVSKIENVKYENENIFVHLTESVRGQDVYVVQCMTTPLQDRIMEMLIIIDALKRASAGRITLVMPYMPYSRSDKKDRPRVPITARLIANMIEVAGTDRYITIDLHSAQIQGFFNIPGDAISAFALMSSYIRTLNIPDLVVCSADLGFVKKARNWAAELQTPLTVVEKRRTFMRNDTEALAVIGDVKDKNVLIVDDEVLTGGTLKNAAAALRAEGAKDIYVAFTHAILKGKALKNFAEIGAKQIITTNTFPLTSEQLLDNMHICSVGPMLGEIISLAHKGRSVGEYLDDLGPKY